MASAILIGVIGGSLYWAHHKVAERGEESTVHMQQLQRAERLSLLAQEAIWEADFALYAYLLHPSARLKTAFDEHLEAAMQHIDVLIEEDWPLEGERQDLLTGLRKNLTDLAWEAARVMEIRADRERRFPSMGTIIGDLYPANLAFMTAASLAIEDILVSTDEPEESEEYRLLVETRRLWSRIIESFRLFLAYRSEALGDPGREMPVLARNIDLLYEGVRQNIQRLDELRKQELLSFQGKESLSEMKRLADEWYANYEKVRSLHASERWRSDDPIVKDRLQPLSSQIRDQLSKLRDITRQSAVQEVATLKSLSGAVIVNVWLIGAAVILFVGAGYFYLERGVLRPVSQVSRALKKQALERDAHELPAPAIREIRDLVGGFNRLTRSLSTAEESRDTAEQIARQASKLSTVGELASCIAHEINNPLNNMVRLTEFLEKELQSKGELENFREDFGVLRQEQRRCADIVRGLLDFSRPKPPLLAPMLLQEVAEESIRLLQRKAQQSKVSIKAHYASSLDPVTGDPDQLEQVLVNLLLNSIASSPVDGVIKLSLENSDGNGVMCRVSDEGPGVPDSEISKIFDPFYTTKQCEDGMGLGLSVSYSIVKRHAGDMGAYRADEEGFVVWFTVPRSETAPPSRDQVQ